MRIAVVSHSCVVDVNQQVYIDLAALPETEVALVMPERWRSEYTGEEFTPKMLPGVTFPVYKMPVAKPGSVNLHFYRKLPVAELTAWKPDVILASQEPYSLSGGQCLWLARKLKADFAFQTNQNLLKKYPPPFSWIESACYREASVAMAYSEEARQVMLQKGRDASRRNVVVPYFTDTRLFEPPVEGGAERIREITGRRVSLGLDGSVVVGYMGRLVPEKGLDTLMEALALLKTKNAAKVLLVGAGAAEEALKAKAKELGVAERVVFAGLVPHSEAGKYMACIDIFTLPSRTTPSWKEQFGRVIIEAMASGAPVVGSDSGEIPNLIRATGGGRVFPEGDAAALAAHLAELIDNPTLRADLAKAGGIVVKERYTSRAVAVQLRRELAAGAAERESAMKTRRTAVAG